MSGASVASRGSVRGGGCAERVGAATGGVYIGLGSNLGDRAAHIGAALVELAERGEVRVVRVSRLHETAAVGGPPGQPPYLNAVAELHADLSPRALLDWMQEIERRHGRVRDARWGPRTLDLDLLLYGDRSIDEPGLSVPHPRMWERAFVLAPLSEICDVDALRRRRGSTRAGLQLGSGGAGTLFGHEGAGTSSRHEGAGTSLMHEGAGTSLMHDGAGTSSRHEGAGTSLRHETERGNQYSSPFQGEGREGVTP